MLLHVGGTLKEVLKLSLRRRPLWIQRAWASKGGAFIMSSFYILLIVLLASLKIDFYEIPPWLSYFVVPGVLFTAVTEGSQGIMSIPFSLLLISLTIYAAIGYMIDWYIKPFK